MGGSLEDVNRHVDLVNIIGFCWVNKDGRAFMFMLLLMIDVVDCGTGEGEYGYLNTGIHVSLTFKILVLIVRIYT